MQGKTKALMLKIMATGYWSDFYVYPIVVTALLSIAIWKLQISAITAALLFIGGFFLWGFAEYFLHRYLMHHAPIFKNGHDEHHFHPRSLLGTPTWLTLTAYLIIAWLIALIIGYGITACWLAGFLMGYYGYVICHHIVHHWRIKPNTFLHRYKKFHDIHHYKQSVNFGVSWHIWDKVFRTHQKSHKTG